MSYLLDLAPLPKVHYTCTTCEVGWSDYIGNKCWNCEEVSEVMEYITVWFMKQHSNQPLWRARTDTHRSTT